MPSPKIAEGFYWVRYHTDDTYAVFVAERFAGAWWQPGFGLELDERRTELLSERLVPPVEAAPIPKAIPHKVPRTTGKR